MMKKTSSIFFLGLLCATFVHADEFTEFRKKYRTLRTVAGNGAKDGGNDWLTSMEGKAATRADLSRPHMTMADAKGNLYIADKEAHAIRKVLPDGSIHTIAGTGRAGFSGDGKGLECNLTFPNGLYVQPDGTVFILDLGNHRIRKLDLQGNLVTLVHDRERIVIGRGLWVSPKGDLIYYCSNSRIRSWTPDKGLGTVAEGFVSLGNIAVDAKGQLYATDRGAGRAYRIGGNGEKVPIAGSGRSTGGGHGSPALETAMPGTRGVALLENGAFLLATHRGGDIWYVDTKGVAHLFIEGEGGGNHHRGDGRPLDEPGMKISEPRAIVMAPNRDLIITTNDTGYVRLVVRQ